jgi:hypothetical protein
LKTFSFDPHYFLIGEIPSSLNFQVPLEVGYNLNFQIDGTLRASASTSGKLTYGWKYQGETGNFTSISNFQMEHQGNLESLTMGEFSQNFPILF